MNIIQSILTNNDCYKAGREITPKGLMLHSVGVPQPSAAAFARSWNTAKPNGASVCVHAFIDGNTGDAHQTLPWNRRGWHCGKGSKGSGNDTHIGVEMCEPACIKYTGGATFTCSDPATAKAVAKRTYDAAVELFAHLCKQYGLNPLADGVIISHEEGAARGTASNHGDPTHLWDQLGMGYTMDGFRQAVNAAMNGGAPSGGDSLYRVQVGAFNQKANADAYLSKIKAAGFDTYMVQVEGLYKIQVGAFSQWTNAEAMMARLKAAGFDAFITGGSGGTSQGAASAITKGDKVKVKAGAKDYEGGGLARFVYSTVFTVMEVNGDRVVIGLNGVVTAAMRAGDLIKV